MGDEVEKDGGKPVVASDYKFDPYDSDVEMSEALNTIKPAIAIIGPPCCGKSALAALMADKMRVPLISADALIAAELAGKPVEGAEEEGVVTWSEIGKSMLGLLKAGKDIDKEIISQLVTERMSAPDCKLTGYVLDGIPPIDSFGSSVVPPTHIIDLTIAEPELVYRTSHIQADVLSTTVLSALDRRPKLPRPKPPPKLDEDGNPIEEDEPEPEPEPEDEDKPKPIWLRRPEDVDTNLKKLTAAYTTRRRAFVNMAERHGAKVLSFPVLEGCNELYTQVMDQLQIGVRPVEPWLIDREFVRSEMPRAVGVSAEDVPEWPDQEKAILTANGGEVDGATGWRRWGKFGRICPVSFVQEGKLVVGRPEFAVAYKGRTYLCASKEKQQKLLSSPVAEMTAEPVLHGLVLFIVGPPLSGKSTLAQVAANLIPDCTLISFERLIDDCLAEKDSDAAKEWMRTVGVSATSDERLIALLRERLGITPEEVAKIEAEMKEKEKRERPEGDAAEADGDAPAADAEGAAAATPGPNAEAEPPASTAESGEPTASPAPVAVVGEEEEAAERPAARKLWTNLVIDCFPYKPEQLQLLLRSGLIPQRCIVLGEEEIEPDLMTARMPAKSSLGKFFTLSNIVGEPVAKAVKERQYGGEVEEGKTNWLEKAESEFKQSLPDLLAALTALNCDIVKVPRDTTLAALKQAMARATNPFSTSAVAIAADEINPLQLYGYSAKYCPVTLSRHGALAAGKDEFAAIYKGKLFKFVGEEEHRAFLDDPDGFAPITSAACDERNGLMQPPPPILMITGPRGAGKTTHARALSLFVGVPYLNLRQELTHVPVAPDAPAEPPEPPAGAAVKERKPKLDDEGNAMVDDEGQPVYEDEADEEAADTEEPEAEVAEVSAEMLLLQLKALLAREPYKSRGVILEGEPLDADTIATMIKVKIYPDVVINMTVSEETVVRRVYDPPPAPRPRDRPPPTVDEEGNPVDAEMPEEVPLPEKDELIDAIKAKREEETATMDATTEVLQAEGVHTVTIDASQSLKIVTFQLRRAVDKYTRCRATLLAAPKPITRAQAAALIESGHKAISSARFHSPVLLHAQHFAPQPQHEHHPGSLDFPLVLGHYVYFAASDDDRRALADQPTRFLPAVPAPARVPPKIIVMGGPKSGRSTLARDLARDFGCVRLSMSRVIEWVVKGTLLLGKQLSKLLDAGQDVPDELCIAALDLRLSSCECVSNGWVLDGFPTTMSQVELLEAAGIVAHKIFFLDVSGTEMLLRSQRKFEAVARTRGSVPKLDAMAIAETNIEQHELSQRDLLAAICAKRDNVHVVDGERSKFWLHTHCRTVVSACIGRRQRYVRAIACEQAAACTDLGGWITHDDMQARMSRFGRYCAVVLRDQRELHHISSKKLDVVCEYKARYYLFSSQAALEKFAVHPAKYLISCLLPVELPKQLESSVAHGELELDGHCPVAFALGEPLRGPPHLRAVKGLPDLVVEYAERRFSISSERNLARFMRAPWKFVTQRLPKKLPPPTEVMAVHDVNSLPPLGYLEQTVVDVLTAALTDLGKSKPKYPFLSNKESALKYLALYLKAANPRNERNTHVANKFDRRFAEFKQHCELLSTLCKPWSESGLTEPEYLAKAALFDQIQKSGLKGMHATWTS